MDEIDAKAALELGISFYGKGKLEEAIPYYEKALGLFKETNNPQVEADTLLEIGDIYIELNDSKKAHEFYEKSLKLYTDNKDLIGEGYALTGLGVIYQKNNEYGKSREFYKNALKKFKKAKDNRRTAVLLSLIANTYESQDAVEDAMIKYEKSLELFIGIKDTKRANEIKEKMDELHKERYRLRSSKKQILVLMGYLIAIIIAEVMTAFFNVEIGLLIHSIILGTLLVHASLETSYNFSNLLTAMIVIPMIRIIGLSIPLLQVPTLYWFPVIAIPLFVSAIFIIRVQKTNLVTLGLTFGNIPFQLAIGATGIILGFIEYQVLHPKPLIPYFSIESVFFAGIILLISTGFAEELLFRGIIQRNAENLFGKLFGLLYASLLFTSLHIGWQSITDLFFVFGVAIFYGYMFQRTRSLFGITLSHGLSNAVLFLIMPFISF